MANRYKTWPIFWRLMKFTHPYRRRLLIGVLAGMISGGALFGVLHSMPKAMDAFKNFGPPTEQVVESENQQQENKSEPQQTVVERVANYIGVPLSREDGGMSWQVFMLTLLGVPIFAMAWSACVFLNHYYLRWVGTRVVTDLRGKIFNHIQQQSLGFFGKAKTGEIISQINNDTMLVEYMVSNSIADGAQAPSEILAAIAFSLTHASNKNLGQVFLLVVLIIPFCIIPLVYIGRKVRKITGKSLRSVSSVLNHMQETLSGIATIKAFHTEEQESKRFDNLNISYFRQVVRAAWASLMVGPVMDLLAIIMVWTMVIYCYAHKVSILDILPVIGAIFFIYKPIKQMGKVYSSVQRSTAAAGRIFEVLDNNCRLPEKKNAVKISGLQKGFSIKNLSFKYEEDAPLVLKNINLEVPCGKVVAFVGKTGSGKTTMLQLIARFYDPTQGEITIDGHDLRDINITSLRRQFGIVGQETFLFNDTIANNISYGTPEATQEDIIEAAKKANAWEFISKLEMGLDHIVGERGKLLSGGQRQRLAIARAILRNPPILILDEATSALDTETEKLVQQAISQAMENRTVFAVAHRLSTIRSADIICVMDEGQIVECGQHEELYSKNNVYRKLHDMQFAL